MSSSKPAKPSFSAPKAKPSFSAPKPSGKKPATCEKSDRKPVKPASAKNVKKTSTKTSSSSSSEAKPVKKTTVDGAGDAKHVEKHPKGEDQVEREARVSEPTPIEPSAANEGQVSDDEEEFNGFEGSDDEKDEADTSAEKDEADTSVEKDEHDTSAEKDEAEGNEESDTEEKPDQQQKPAAAEKKAGFAAPAAKPGASKPSKPPKVEKAPAKPPKSLTEEEYEDIFEAVFERYPPCSSQELKEFEESVARNAVTHEENKKALAAAAKEREKERKEAAKQQAKEQKEAAKQQAKEDKVFKKAQQEARRAENEARKAEIQAQKAAHEALAKRQREDMGKAQKSKDPNSKAPKPKAQKPKATKPVKEKLPEPQAEQNLLDDDEQEEFAGFEDEDDVNNNSFNADEDNENERNSDSDASDDMDHDLSDDNQADDDDNDGKRQEGGSSDEEGDFQGFGGESDDEKEEDTYEERLNQVLQGSQEAAIPVPNLAAQVSNPKSRPQQKKKLYERPSTFSTLSDQTRKKTQKAFRLQASDKILSGPLGHRVDKSVKNKDSHRKSSSSSSRPKHSENRSKTASKHKLPRTHEEPSSKQRRPSHDVRASAGQSGKQKRQSSKDWMLEREIDTSGTWVQCSSRACLKWRYLPDVHDPATLPDVWLCSMNRNSRLNSCDVPEESWDEDEHAEDFIFTKFTEGSLVWAKMAGYPFWPAMVEVDPDFQMFCDCRDLKGVVSHYHCVFLDDHVSRAWVGTTMIRPFTGAEDPKHFGSTKVRGKDYKKLLAVAKVKAMTALKMPIEQRLRKYSFVKRYEGRWGRDQASADSEPERLVVRTKTKKDFKKKKSAAKPQRERKFSRPSLESACSSRPSVESLSDLSDEDLEADVDHSDNDPENDLESFCDLDAAEVDAMIEGAINEEDIPVDDLLDESRDFGDDEEESKSRSRSHNGAAQQKPAQVKEKKSRDTKKKEGSKKKTPASTTDGLKKKTPLNYDDLPKDDTKAKKQKQSSKKPTAPYGKEVEQVKKSLFMSPVNTPEKPENVKNSPETTANHVSKDKENQSKSCDKGSSRRGWKSTEKRKSVSFEGPKNKVKKSEDALVPEEDAVTPHESANTPMKEEEEEVQREASSSTKNNDNDDESEADARAETAPEKAELCSQTSQKSERASNSQNASSQKSLVEASSQKSHQSEKAPNSQNASSQKSVAEASSQKSQKVSGSQNSKRRETLEKDFEHLYPDGSPAPKSEQENADTQSDNEELESSLDIPVKDNEENEEIFPKGNTDNSAEKPTADAADDDDSEPFDTDPLAHFECEVKQASPSKEEEKATNSGAESEDFDFDD